MTDRLNSSQYSLDDTHSKVQAAQVFADASNVTYTYKQFFVLSDIWRWETPNETLRDRRLDILRGLKRFFEAAAAAADAEAQPFGGRECGLLPSELRRFTAQNFTIAPRLSATLYALAHELDKISNKLQNNQEMTGGDVFGSIMDVCETTGVGRVTDHFNVKPAKTLLGSGCEDSAAMEGSVEKAMKEAMLSYARSHDFPTNNDNGCLQIFIARYTRLSAPAVELLRRSIYINIYITMNVHAFCTPFIQMSDPKEPENENAHMVEALRSGLGLLGKLTLNNTVSWSCAEFTTSKAPTTLPSKTTTVVPSNITGFWGNTTVSTVITTITSMPDKARAKWREEAQKVAKKTISAISEHIQANTWEKRSKELHRAITAALDANIAAKFPIKNTPFYSVAMLTYDDNGKSCTKENNDSIHGTHEHVTYLAQPDFGDKLAPYADLLEKHEQEILDKTFSSPSNNLCEIATKALKDVIRLSVEKKASPFVAVACGYEFVWYELGYKYFPAANSTSPYVLTSRPDSDYTSNCGQIVLFP